MRVTAKHPTFVSTPALEDRDEVMRPTVFTPPTGKIQKGNAVSKEEIDTRAEQWVRASCALRDKPSLMTSRILLLALRNQPPLHAVRFMLSLNPKSASIPKKGPTPLQVAVQHNASIEVIQCLLAACPFALCATNPDYAEDPLSYVKRNRKNDHALIELLSRPLNFWISERTRDPKASITSFREDVGSESRIPPPPTTPSVDRQELQNVKILCTQLLKGHKKMARQMAGFQKELEAAHIDKAQVLKELHEQQSKHFYRQLIALDMKEKAMRAYVSNIEQRCIKNCEAKMQGWRKGIDSWKSTAEDRMQEWRVLLNHEIKVNAHFRNDLSLWMEGQLSEVTTMPSIFATPLGEINETLPLFPKGSSAHSKKKIWKPLFRHRDRIVLRDEEET